MGIGLAYATIVAHRFATPAYLTVLLTIAIVAVFTYFGNHVSKVSGTSDWRILVLIPLIPAAMAGAIMAFGFVLLIGLVELIKRFSRRTKRI
jgi:hypothetical protein